MCSPNRWSVTTLLVILPATLGTADPPAPVQAFKSLVNGSDLSQWQGNFKLWSARDGVIVGKSPGIKNNEFLTSRDTYEDFELRLEFRLHAGQGNSGIQFRSRRAPNSTAVIGYQADIGQDYWGCLYDEHRRRKVLAHAPPELAKVLKKSGWNTYQIRAEGPRVTLTINGLKTVDYRESDKDIARSGIVALQIHSGSAMQIDFRNIRIRKLHASRPAP